MRDTLARIVADRPECTIYDFNGTRRCFNLSSGPASTDFLVDRFSGRLWHLTKLTWELLADIDLDFVFELHDRVFAYYFPQLVLLYIEAAEAAFVLPIHERFKSAFETALSQHKNLTVLSREELQLLKWAVTETAVAFESEKQRSSWFRMVEHIVSLQKR